MARNFHFGADATMASGSALFSALINEDAAAFGLTEAQAMEYREIDLELQEAMAAATTPTTRSPVAIARKNGAVKAMQRRASDLRGIITSTDSVSNAQLLALGLLPRSRRARRSAPESAPFVRLVSTIGRRATIHVTTYKPVANRARRSPRSVQKSSRTLAKNRPRSRATTNPSSSRPERTRPSPFRTMCRTAQRSGSAHGGSRGAANTGTASAPTRFLLAGGDVVARSDDLRIAA